MASLNDVTVGQVIELKQLLAKAGMNLKMVESMIREPSLAEGMVEWLRNQLESLQPELFVSLKVQLANVRRWNLHRDWGFTDVDFDAIDITPVSRPGLEVDVIAVYLPGRGNVGGIQRTFEELWDIASSNLTSNWRDESLELNKSNFRLLKGIVHKPGIRRVTLDLGANWDSVNDTPHLYVRGKYSAHAEVLAAAAHFPDWVKAMDGKHIPHVWMAGYQFKFPNDKDWQGFPYLFMRQNLKQLELYINTEDIPDYGTACPVLVRKES